MIIAVDVDDTVVGLMDAWLKVYNQEWNDDLKKEEITDWDITKFVKEECGYKIFSYLDHRFYDNVIPVPGALEGIYKLKNRGHRIIYVTSAFPQHAGRKFDLLKQYGFIENHHDYVECSDKSLIRADFLIDDNFVHVSNFKGISILYNQPWNRKYWWYACADNWDDVTRLLEERTNE